MAASIFKLETLKNLAPDEKRTRHWNNATPWKAVWYIQAIPSESSIAGQQGTHSFEVEVTRVWRKMNSTFAVPKDIPQTTTEHEVYYEVENVGDKVVDVDIYASVIS